MKKQILDILCCPNCKHSLTLIEREVANNEVIDGILKCNNCQNSFKIIKGVPRMIVSLSDQKIDENWDFQWSKRAEKKFEITFKYGKTEEDELNDFFNYLGVIPDDLKGKYILDAGCGIGRLTKMLGNHDAEVFGIDMSSSIEYAYEYCKPFKNVNIIQANILNIPFKNATFDYVWSKGVIHHTGNAKYAFENLCDLLKSSGKLFVWVYSKKHPTFVSKLRDFLKISHKIPRRILFYFCYFLALPLSLVKIARKLLRLEETPNGYLSIRTNAFILFDVLSPEIATRHSKEEIIGWFNKKNFHNIIIEEAGGGGIAVRGIKK